MKNKFDQLVEDLTTDKISWTMLQTAVKASIRNRKDLPEGIKDLLCGRSAHHAGLIQKHFQLISETIGSMELAYRRGGD